MDDAQQLATYTAAWQTTQRMLEVARAEEWDQLVELGQSRDALLATVMQAPNKVLDLSLAGQLEQLMRQILSTDQQIQRLSQAWMDEIQGVLSSVQVEQKLLKAYDPL